MKTILTTFLLLVVAKLGFADEFDSYQKDSKIDTTHNEYRTTYMRLGGGALPLGGTDYLAAPLGTIGWQYREGQNGIDLSGSLSGASANDAKVFSYTLPKISYVRFFSNNRNNGLYAGVGSSFYGINTSKKKEVKEEDYTYTKRKVVSDYHGLAGAASIGYNYKLGEKLQSSVQLGANMPTPLAVYSKGDVYKPSFELNLGLGF